MGIDLQFMELALDQGRLAYAQGEVPIGAVLVRNGSVIGAGYNQVIRGVDPTLHAEIVALRQGAQEQNNYRLPSSTLYVSLEPCIMCLGAILHARVARLVVGALDPKVGALKMLDAEGRLPGGNHCLEVTTGVLQDRCSQQLTQFFKERRNKKDVRPLASCCAQHASIELNHSDSHPQELESHVNF